jgi:hypothetical protein
MNQEPRSRKLLCKDLLKDFASLQISHDFENVSLSCEFRNWDGGAPLTFILFQTIVEQLP